MEINFTLDKNDLKEYYKRANRSTVIAWGLLILVFGTMIVVGAVIHNYSLFNMGLLITIFSAVFLLLTFIKVIAVYKRSAKELKNDVITVSITEDCFQVKKSGKIRWEYILDVFDYKNYYVLKLPKIGVFILPKRALDNESEKAFNEYYKKGLKNRKAVLKNKTK
ncbi:MAG TPA: YcxB family protein [Clostridia bacterium]